ncbi:MAG: hypothetical protein ACUVTR_02045 [Dehalococcoidia bacterium]
MEELECGLEELYPEYAQAVPQITPAEAELESKYPGITVQFYGEEGYRIHGEAIDTDTGEYLARVRATTEKEAKALLDKELAKKRLTRAFKTQLRKLISDVPDVNDPSKINYWVKVDDKEVYLEGWCDKCLAGTGYPPMEAGETLAKLAYMKDMTKEILPRKAKERGLELIEGGFIELEEAKNLYGVTYGVYRRPR